MRLRRGVRPVLVLLPLALWMCLAMMLVHELGHLAGAWLTGGTVVLVDVYPGRLPGTLIQPNPRPSVVLWSGLLSGWLVPLATALFARRWFPRTFAAGALECFAAFCLLTGGAYLAIGGTERLTDTGQLMAVGWPLPLLIGAGAGAAVIGYVWSRRAWPVLLARLRGWLLSVRAAALVWVGLSFWCAGQWVLADILKHLANVR